jgi:hypothetical protein
MILRTHRLLKGLAVFAILLSETGNASISTAWTDQSWAWMNKNYMYVVKEIESEDSEQIIPIMNTIGTIWLHRDGGLWAESAKLMLLMVTHHPKVFFCWFYLHKDSYEDFLNIAIGQIYFSALDEVRYASRKTERGAAIEALEQYLRVETVDEYQEMALLLMTKLQNTNLKMAQ